MNPNIIVIVGPTAAGKSALALRWARLLSGEIVSADSMQVYRHFDIGTGKPSRADRQEIVHHLIDIIDPTDVYSAARFVEQADLAIADIIRRGKLPIVVGGTGLYVRALLHGLFPAPPNDAALRKEHQEVLREQGVFVLYEELRNVDPEAAARIEPTDFVRISRALEVFALTGERISELHQAHQFRPERYQARLIGLDPGEDLRPQIDARVDQMCAAGWLAEVECLVAQGYGHSHPMGALGYRHLFAHVTGYLDLAEAIRQTKRDTWRFARRQRNWFRSDHRVIWYTRGTDVPLEGAS